MDQGEESVEDEHIKAQLRATARRINLRAFITALIITLVAITFPALK